MPEPIEKVLEPSYPHLPEDLWLRIACLLPTKEWARASGTCKALQQLQVERISIQWYPWKVSVATSALIWVARHLHGARKIVMNGWPARSAVSKEDLIAVCSAMQTALKPDAQPLSLLKVLSLRIGRPQQVSGILEDPVASTYLLGILQKATNLSCLNIICKTVPALPQMASLKHLSLRVEGTSAEQVSEVLWGMPSLETLQLSQHPQGRVSLGSYLVVPAWVQHLELDNVYPSSLTLGSGNTRVALCGSAGGLELLFERWGDARRHVKGLQIQLYNSALYHYRVHDNGSKL